MAGPQTLLERLERIIRSFIAGITDIESCSDLTLNLSTNLGAPRMKAFLSHSSKDKDLVVAVHEALEKNSTWLDRAEIEWGDLFLEKIAEGLEEASDFVLFWSKDAAKSEWVRLEVNMAFILKMREKAIRLRVITLDATKLPLQLQPFHHLSFDRTKISVREIVEKLVPLLNEPVRSARSRFVNRHAEIGLIEDAVDDPELRAVLVHGFSGSGRSSVLREALSTIFHGADIINVDVTPGTGLVELALKLNALVRNEQLPESLPLNELQFHLRVSVEMIAKEERLLLLTNVQHWLAEDATPEGPLAVLMDIAATVEPFSARPVFFTSTRQPVLVAGMPHLGLIKISALRDEHIAVIIRNWFYAIHGRELDTEDALKIAPKMFGHPVAARLVSGLLGIYGVDYLERYPRELIALRRDLARVMLQDIKLDESAERLMNILAMVGVGLSAPLIASTGFSDDQFQDAVFQCTRAGLISVNETIQIHPLFQEFFWHHLHRMDYTSLARILAETLHGHITALDKTSKEFVSLLQPTYRMFAIAGDLRTATNLRRDFSGELAATAVLLYNRRKYDLADEYITHVLDYDPDNWRMRLYRARIRVRQERWKEADEILSQMVQERPGDNNVIITMGWRQLRAKNWEVALEIFTTVISRRDHARALHFAAECLHRLNRYEEALEMLARAKNVESENAYVLDLESRILEDMGLFEAAYQSALLASARDPLSFSLRNRLGIIQMKRGRPDLAIPHLQKAIELDPDHFGPINSLASAYLDDNKVDDAEALVPLLEAKSRTPDNEDLVKHTKAHIAFARGDLADSEKILKREIDRGRNLIPNLGLLSRVECALFDQNEEQFPAIAQAALISANEALAKIKKLDPSNKFIDTLSSAITYRQARV